MNGDLSRVTFNPLKHFTSIVLQQGRVQMDSDANEQTAILLHYLRSMVADLIGPHGGPEDLSVNNVDGIPQLRGRNCGFAIIAAKGPREAPTFFPDDNLLDDEKKVLTDALGSNQLALAFTGGHYYVKGHLCENETPWRYADQPYLQRANDDEIKKLVNGVYLVYLDVWERFVSSVDDPSIREVALGGADTAARMKLIWQVKIGTAPLEAPPNSCEGFNDVWPEIKGDLNPPNRGRLSARARGSEADAEEDVCITSPEARYRGLENQLYRVEIHRGGPASQGDTNLDVAATFKWSRNNATNVVALKEKNGDRLIVSGLRDFSRWFRPGEWIEVTHEALELRGLPGTLVRLAGVEGETLTIDPYTTSGTIPEPDDLFENLPIRNLKVRGWDHTQPEDDLLIDGAIPVEENQEIELEDGVFIKFQTGNPAHQYRTGDYWVIPARVATGDVEWPQQRVKPDDPANTEMEAKPLPPNGIDHHFAPLAALTLDGGAVTQIVDLRHVFEPLARCATPANR